MLKQNGARPRLCLASHSILAGLLLLFAVRDVSGDSFDDEMALIDKRQMNEVGRDALIEAYKQLLADYPNDPRRSQVMLTMSARYQNVSPELGIESNPEQELYWLREARKISPQGSLEWLKANFRIAGAIYWDDPGEARRILETILDHAPDVSAQARAYLRLQMIAGAHKEVEEAEKICVKLQDLIVEWDKLPDEILGDRGRIYRDIQASESLMMMNWAEATNLSVSKRIEKINNFAERARLRRHIERDRDSALKFLSQLSGDSKFAVHNTQPDMAPRTQPQSQRWFVSSNNQASTGNAPDGDK